jgi:hypothetical protein
MPRSLANGDYSLVMAIESASRANSWYRVLADRRTGNLSCDCPAWTFRQDGNPTQARSCKHTRLAQQLAGAQQVGTPIARANGAAAETNLLIQATRQQWPGLGGRWGIEQRTHTFDNAPYSFVLLRLATGNGTHATGLVAFAQRYHPTQESMVAGTAGWAGYAIAAEVARQAGYPMAGQPPDHFKVTRGTGTRTRCLGLGDILRVGDQIDLGDGYTPTQRAENTLRLFLGETLYTQLEHRHFLDISSIRYADRQRVYRLRRDPHKSYERRIRIFEYGEYINDYCVVRSQDVPEGDHFLTVFLGLLSDEQTTLSVVGRGNIFPPHSDGREQEVIPVAWQPRVA